MATMTVSFGTQVWIAELVRSGWSAAVMERCTLDDNREEVGVLVDDQKGNGVFVPCSCEHEAIALLDAALEEAS